MYKNFRVPPWDDIKLLRNSEKYFFSCSDDLTRNTLPGQTLVTSPFKTVHFQIFFAKIITTKLMGAFLQNLHG